MSSLRTAAPNGRLRLIAAAAVLTASACGTAGAGRLSSAASTSLPGSAPSGQAQPSAPAPSPAASGSTPAAAPPSARAAGSAPGPTPLPSPTSVADPIGAFPPPASAPTLGGCQVFPSDNPWNQDISSAPLDANSAAYISRIDSFRQYLHPDFGSDPTYGIPYVVVPGSQPLVPITFTAYGDQSDPGPYPVPLNAPVESGSDAHVLVADSGNCHLYELYNAKQVGSGWDADSGAVFDLNSNALRPDTWTSADAAGLPILPGLVRYDEVTAGVINHALRFTVNESQNGFIHPATHQAGVNNTNDPPMGLRLRLKASFDLTPFHGAALVVLTALKKYGMIVADNGSSWFISGSTDTRWNDSDLNQLKNVPGSAFEAVQTGPILH